METKRTTATVRVMLSHNFCNFEVQTTIENSEGISFSEIDNEGLNNHKIAQTAVNMYIAQNPTENKVLAFADKKSLAQKVEELKSKKVLAGEVTDPEEIKRIENLPLVDAKKWNSTKPKDKIKK